MTYKLPERRLIYHVAQHVKATRSSSTVPVFIGQRTHVTALEYPAENRKHAGLKDPFQFGRRQVQIGSFREGKVLRSLVWESLYRK
jgi:hypothetical protein